MRRMIIISVSAVALLLCGALVFADETTDFELLTIGVGARPFGMGGVYAAIADDANASYWNPAGLGNLDRRELTGMWSEAFGYEYVSYTHPVEDIGTFGMSGYYYQYKKKPQGMQLYDIYDISYMLSYGRAVNDMTSIGVNMKLLRKDFIEQGSVTESTMTVSGFGTDIGILYKAPGDIYLAAVVQNLTPFVSKRLPLNYRLGTAVRFFDDIITFAFDLNLPESEPKYVTFGTEFWLLNWIALRAGYNTRAGQNQGIHFGLGVGSEDIHLDYIVSLFKSSEDFINRISLTWRFGRSYKYALIEEKIEKHFQKGRRAYYRGELIKSYNEFKNVLELVPGHKGASEYLARTEAKLDEYETSREIERHLEKGEAYFKKGDMVGAKVEFDTILVINPGHKGSNSYLKKIEEKTGQLVQSYFNKGVAYYQRTDYREALENMEKVLSFSPYHADASRYVSRINEKLEKIEEAKKKQKGKGKWEARTHFLMGRAFFNIGKWKESIKEFEQVLDYNPDHEGSKELLAKANENTGNSYYEKGLGYMKEGKNKESLDQFKEARKYIPDDAKLRQKIEEVQKRIASENRSKAEEYYALGLKNYTEGDTMKAVKMWELARNLDPNNANVESALKRAREEIKLKSEADNRRKADEYYQQGLKSYSQGDLDSAIKIWEMGKNLDPGNATIENALKRAREELSIKGIRK